MHVVILCNGGYTHLASHTKTLSTEPALNRCDRNNWCAGWRFGGERPCGRRLAAVRRDSARPGRSITSASSRSHIEMRQSAALCKRRVWILYRREWCRYHLAILPNTNTPAQRPQPSCRSSPTGCIHVSPSFFVQQASFSGREEKVNLLFRKRSPFGFYSRFLLCFKWPVEMYQGQGCKESSFAVMLR